MGFGATQGCPSHTVPWSPAPRSLIWEATRPESRFEVRSRKPEGVGWCFTPGVGVLRPSENILHPHSEEMACGRRPGFHGNVFTPPRPQGQGLASARVGTAGDTQNRSHPERCWGPHGPPGEGGGCHQELGTRHAQRPPPGLGCILWSREAHPPTAPRGWWLPFLPLELFSEALCCLAKVSVK